jgi:hypothetical protein
LTIGEALAFGTLNSKRVTFPVIEAQSSAGVVAEVVFGEVTVKVLLGAMLVPRLKIEKYPSAELVCTSSRTYSLAETGSLICHSW